jgi:peptide/nickel transport system substrate-binding protein
LQLARLSDVWVTLRRVAAATACLALVPAHAQTPAQPERTLRLLLGAEPTTLDPHQQATAANLAFASHLYDRLVHRDGARVFLPGLAESWAETEPGVWTFQLRAGVTFHDGRPFTADDVVATVARVLALPNGPTGLGRTLKGKTVSRVDDRTLRITSDRPEALLLADLAQIAILPKANAISEPAVNTKPARPIGTGPFRFTAGGLGDKFELTAFGSHWAGPPHWDRVIVRTQRVGTARVSALIAGEVDAIDDVPVGELGRLRAEPKVQLLQTPSHRVMLLMFDQWRENTPFANARDGSAIRNPFRNAKVRRAVAYAIDRDSLVTKALDGHAAAASQLLSGVANGAKLPAYEPDKARRLLAEAGFPNGFKITLHGPAGRYANDLKLIEAIAQMLTKVGIETTIETLPPYQFFNRASAGADGQPEFSFMLAGALTAPGDAAAAVRSLLATADAATGDGALNRGRYSSKAFDEALDQAARLPDAAQRHAALVRAVDLALADVAIVPLLFPFDTWAARKNLVIRSPGEDGLTALSIRRAGDDPDRASTR